MTDERTLKQEVARIIREALAETKSWGWHDDDRRLSASGAALKYLEQHSDLDHDVAVTVAGMMTREIMAQEEPLLRYCVHCGRYHPINDLDAGWHCPLERDPQ